MVGIFYYPTENKERNLISKMLCRNNRILVGNIRNNLFCIS